MPILPCIPICTNRVKYVRLEGLYFNATLKTRFQISRQQNKVNQVTVYAKDLDTAYATPLPYNIPLVIINTDFETACLNNIDDDAEKQKIIQWRNDGNAWYQYLANRSTHEHHIMLSNQDHLAPLFNYQLIEMALSLLSSHQGMVIHYFCV